VPDRAMTDRRYHAHAGFVTTPRYFDDSPQQFLQVAPPGTGVLQRVNHIDDYEYELDQRAENFDLLAESAVCLGRSHCEVIGQVGTNWVHCNGTTPEDIIEICAEISIAAGARFFMAGHCLVDGLRAIGAERITVANGYYRPDWSAGINAYLEAAGFEILWAGDLIDQGLVADHDEKLAIEADTLWDYPNHLMVAAAVDAHRRAPGADAVVQTGAGFRMLQVADTVESQIGKPLVASDVALYWAMLDHLQLSAAPGHGHLLAMLG
jgi:maleate cis-trans isomerase